MSSHLSAPSFSASWRLTDCRLLSQFYAVDHGRLRRVLSTMNGISRARARRAFGAYLNGDILSVARDAAVEDANLHGWASSAKRHTGARTVWELEAHTPKRAAVANKSQRDHGTEHDGCCLPRCDRIL